MIAFNDPMLTRLKNRRLGPRRLLDVGKDASAETIRLVANYWLKRLDCRAARGRISNAAETLLSVRGETL